MTFRAPLVRVYFNRREDSPKVWSVDFGGALTSTDDPTCEILCVWVTVQATGNTHFTSGPHEKYEPCAWMEYHDVEVTINGNVIKISDPTLHP